MNEKRYKILCSNCVNCRKMYTGKTGLGREVHLIHCSANKTNIFVYPHYTCKAYDKDTTQETTND